MGENNKSSVKDSIVIFQKEIKNKWNMNAPFSTPLGMPT